MIVIIIYRYHTVPIIIHIQPQREETYGDSSICIDRVLALSSHSCGTYVEKSVMPLCVSQETYTINDSDQYAYAIQLKGEHIQ